jgi:hypothetical protein
MSSMNKRRKSLKEQYLTQSEKRLFFVMVFLIVMTLADFVRAIF